MIAFRTTATSYDGRCVCLSMVTSYRASLKPDSTDSSLQSYRTSPKLGFLATFVPNAYTLRQSVD